MTIGARRARRAAMTPGPCRLPRVSGQRTRAEPIRRQPLSTISPGVSGMPATQEPGWVDNRIQRRRFLVGGAAALAASVAAGVGGERLREVLTEPQSGTGPITPYISAWVAVATLDEVTPGKIKQFSAGGIQGVVFTLKGEIRALSAVCTHQGCTLVPEPADNKLVCPCHPMSFALTGTQTPATTGSNPLPTIKTRVTRDNVEALVPSWT